MKPLYGNEVNNAWYRIGRMAMMVTAAGAALVVAASLIVSV